jgi:hypothetical protein
LAAWALYKVFDPGIAIGMLATAAGIMSLRPTMHFREKLGWIAILIALTTAEVRSIHKSEREGLERNQAILDGMTGGDSYLSISPMPASPATADNAGEISFLVSVMGKHTLWDVRVQMAETPDPLQFYLAGRIPQSIILGAVSNTYASGLGPLVRPSLEKENVYYFWVWSRNLPTVEALRVRFNRKLNHWECAWTIWRIPDIPKTQKDILKDFPWTEMAAPAMMK